MKKKVMIILMSLIVASVFVGCADITPEDAIDRATTTSTGATRWEAEEMTKGGSSASNTSSPFTGVVLYANNDKVSFNQYFSNNSHTFKLRGVSTTSEKAQVQLKIGGTAFGIFEFTGTTVAEKSITASHNKGGGTTTVELICINDNGKWDAKIDWLEISSSSSSTTTTTTNTNTNTNTNTTTNTNTNTTTSTTSSGATRVETEKMTVTSANTISSPFAGVVLYSNSNKVSFDQYFSNNSHTFKLRGASSNTSKATVQLKIGGTAYGTFEFTGTAAAEKSITASHNKGGGTTTVELVCVNDNGSWDVYLDWLEISASGSSGSTTTTGSSGGSSSGGTTTTQPSGETILHSKWPFKVGAEAPGSAFTTSNGQYVLLKQFEVLVAENDMKPDAIMPTSKPATLPGTYRWTNADKLVSYAQANNKGIRGHVLVWHAQTPAWYFQGSGKSGRATKAELYQRMEAHIKTVFEKYGGKIGWWDVCNEVVDDSGNGPRTNSEYTKIMEDSGLTGVNRYEFVLKAFEYARKYADANGGTNVKLYLTDYNTEYSGNKQTQFESLVNYLITNKAPIDGIGFQTHIRFDFPSVSDISTAIDKFSGKTNSKGTKLMTQVCELDISIFTQAEAKAGGTLSTSVVNDRLAKQATKYRDLFDMFKTKHSQGKLDMVLVWGLADGESWLNNSSPKRTDHPLLFDRSYKAKPAYNALVK